MFLAAAAIVVLLTVPLFGGSLRRLAVLPLSASWLIWVALGTQIVITELPHVGPHALLDGLHLASYVAAGVFLWWNRALPGLAVIAVGAGCNAVTIAANGGTLPASASALRAAGIHPANGFDNSGVLAHPHLAWLGDVLVTPPWLPLRNVLSVGDLIVVAGFLILAHGVCETRPWRGIVSARSGRTTSCPTTGMQRSSTSSAPTPG